MRIKFVGYALSPERSVATVGSSAAANRYQLGLLGGVHRLVGDDLSVTTRMPAAPWPSSTLLYIRRETIPLFKGCRSALLPMLNIPFVKQFWSAWAAYLDIVRWGRRNPGPGSVVVGYNLNSFLGVAAALAAKARKLVFIYLFTDPPYRNTRKGPLWRAAYRANAAMVRYAIESCDGIVAVNAGAVHAYAPGKPFCVIEGGVDAADTVAAASVQAKTIVYSGGLSSHNGLENLIDGFKQTVDPAYRLRIYGRGALDASLRERAGGDLRIEFPGFVAPDEMTAIQASAAMLVNPRPSGLEICRTTFPSKLMEYLSSGRPVLTTRLPGIPPEYEPYLAFVDDESPAGYAAAIDRLLGLREETLAAMGESGRNFVRSNKNWDEQAGLLLGFIHGVLKAVTP